MDEKYMEYLAWWQVYNEHVDRFRRGARLGTTPADCTCSGAWNSILPPPACPYHGRFDNTQITC